MLKFTIIIPVYNTEKYLERCISSCINQTYSNIEIFCVDDGSTDTSYKVLQNIQKDDNRIMIFQHNKNEGTYMARYTGVINATGDYILFLDSDDALDLHSCELLSKSIEKKKVDIIQFGYKEIPGNQEKYAPFYNSSHKRIKAYLARDNRLSPELWTKAYSSAVIKQAYKAMEVFYAVLAEDLYVSIVVTFFAKTFSFLHQPLVYYSVNIGISKRHMHSLEIYQSWLSSYRIIINKINIFIRENIPEFTILLQDMELYLFKDFLFCRIADNLPINLRRQIFQSLYVYFSENIIDSFYNELVYKYNMYDRYLNFHCSFKTKVKKLIKVIILYIKSFINDFGKLYDHEDNQHRKNTI